MSTWQQACPALLQVTGAHLLRGFPSGSSGAASPCDCQTGPCTIRRVSFAALQAERTRERMARGGMVNYTTMCGSAFCQSCPTVIYMYIHCHSCECLIATSHHLLPRPPLTAPPTNPPSTVIPFLTSNSPARLGV